MRTRIVSTMLFVTLLALGTAPASAGEGDFEVFLGYGYLWDADLSLPLGWNAAVSHELDSGISFVGEVGGNYTSMSVRGQEVGISLHSFLFGSRLDFEGNGRVTPYVQTLGGLARAGAGVDVGGASVGAAINGFALQPGGGLSIRLNDRLSARVGADYRIIFAEGSTNELRVVSGVVFRLGE